MLGELVACTRFGQTLLPIVSRPPLVPKPVPVMVSVSATPGLLLPSVGQLVVATPTAHEHHEEGESDESAPSWQP